MRCFYEQLKSQDKSPPVLINGFKLFGCHFASHLSSWDIFSKFISKMVKSKYLISLFTGVCVKLDFFWFRKYLVINEYMALGNYAFNCLKPTKEAMLSLKQFHATALFLYPLKRSENQRFSDVFMGCRNKPVAWNGFNKHKFPIKVFYEMFCTKSLFPPSHLSFLQKQKGKERGKYFTKLENIVTFYSLI